MSQSDFSNMSRKELADQIAKKNGEIEKMQGELAKKKADEFEQILLEFLNKAEELGVSIDQIIDAIPKKAERHSGKPSSKPEKRSKFSITGFVKGATYVDPADSSQIWSGGSKGPKPRWLLNQFDEKMSPDDMTAVFRNLEKNKF